MTVSIIPKLCQGRSKYKTKPYTSQSFRVIRFNDKSDFKTFKEIFVSHNIIRHLQLTDRTSAFSELSAKSWYSKKNLMPLYHHSQLSLCMQDTCYAHTLLIGSQSIVHLCHQHLLIYHWAAAAAAMQSLVSSNGSSSNDHTHQWTAMKMAAFL